MARCPDIICITEFVPNILYFATVRPGTVLQQTAETHYFSIDEELVYENYYSDFGPLNLACVYKYCRLLTHKLKQHSNKQVIVHYTSLDPKKKTNAAFLLGCYGLLYLGISPREAFRNLSAQGQYYKPFQDAALGESRYTINLLDCLQAIKKARNLGFFSFRDFDCNEYERLNRIRGGDLNWIVPGKFLAFIGPVDYSVSLFHPPEMYIDYFLKNNVKVVIRLNKKMYDANVFKKIGMTHIDLFYPDGSCPPRHILFKFLQISEETNGAIAVHCKAGLGRTGTLISCYLIKHYKMSAHEAIAWIRICRSGSVIGHQQEWLERLESWLLKQGDLYRKRMFANPDKIPTHDYGIYSILERNEEHQAMAYKSNSFPTPSQRFPLPIDVASDLTPQSSKQQDESQDEIFLASCDLTVQEDGQSSVLKGCIIRDGSSTDYPNYTESDRVSREIPLWKKFLSFKHFGDGCDDLLWKLAVGCCRVVPHRCNASKCCDLLDKTTEKEQHQHYVKPFMRVKKSQCNIGEPVEYNQLIRRMTIAGEPRKWGAPGRFVRLPSLTKTTPEHNQDILIKNHPKPVIEDNSRRLKPLITVTTHTPLREKQFEVGSRTTVTASRRQIPRRLLGRSPSPPQRRCVFQQIQSNSLDASPNKINVKKPSKDNIRMSSSMERSTRVASVGAASLDARRDAPAQLPTASARSDQRTFATQGDMLNSVKLQRRMRESIQLDHPKPVKKESPRIMDFKNNSYQRSRSPPSRMKINNVLTSEIK